jgi:hypothetical protein
MRQYSHCCTSKASKAAAKTPSSDSHCTSRASNAAVLALLVSLALTHPCIASSSSSSAAVTRFGIIGFMPRDTWATPALLMLYLPLYLCFT